jgi:hypothetical protein
VLYYEKNYDLADPTSYMKDMTDDFPWFPSSQLIEILKQNELMRYFIEEYFINTILYTPKEIEFNKKMLMIFFLHINRATRLLFSCESDAELDKKFEYIQEEIQWFFNEIIPNEAILNKNLLSDKERRLIGLWDIKEREFFSSLAFSIVKFIFHTATKTKFRVLTIICRYFGTHQKFTFWDEGFIGI